MQYVLFLYRKCPFFFSLFSGFEVAVPLSIYCDKEGFGWISGGSRNPVLNDRV